MKKIDKTDVMKMLNDPQKYVEDLEAEIRKRVEAELKTTATVADKTKVEAEKDPVSPVSSEESVQDTFQMLEECQDVGYIESDDTAFVHKTIENMRKDKKGFVFTLVKGAHGTGKTMSCFHYAFKNKLPVLRVDCATIRDNEKWFGERALINGNTKFVPSLLVKCLEKGNCVILLDEANRVPEIGILNPLLPVFDLSGKVHVSPMGRDVVLGKNIAVFMTMNEGASYSGVTDYLDEALSNRANLCIKMRYPSSQEEKNIVKKEVPGIEDAMLNKIVNIADTVRKSQLSNKNFMIRRSLWTIRTSINAARAYVASGKDVKILKEAVMNFFNDEGGISSEQTMVAGALEGGIGGITR